MLEPDDLMRECCDEPGAPLLRNPSRREMWLHILLRLALLAALVLFFALISLQAQTPVAVTGHAGDVTGGAVAGVDIQFALANCGANQPRIFGSFGIIRQVADFLPDPSTGVITGTLWPNDAINCGGTTGGTYYNVTFLQNNVPQGPALCYIVLSTQNPFNLDAATPCTTLPGPPSPNPPVDATYNNLTLTGALAGTTAVFGGRVSVGSLLLGSAPNPCGAGTYMTGLTAALAVNCSGLPGAPVSSVFGRTGAIAASSGDYVCAQIAGAVCSLPALYYQALRANGAAQTQRTALNLIAGAGMGVSCADNSGAGSTDCTISSTVTPPSSRTCNANGCYKVDADGTIWQWGTSFCGAVTCTITFPAAFTTTANLSITDTPDYSQGNLTSVTSGVSTTGFLISNNGVVNVGGSGLSYSGGATNHWQARGY